MHITLGEMVSYLHSAGLTILSFAVLISVIVFFHEVGHLLVGKWLGVKAVRFSIGFGPRLFGVQWGETEYRVSLLPLGGYVKFAGDNPLEQLPPEDRGRGFLEQPPRKKAAIAFAGPAANFLLALVLYFAVNASPHRDIASTVGYVKPASPAAQLTLDATGGDAGIESADLTLFAVQPGSAAAEAGLRRGDRVLTMAGKPIVWWFDEAEAIRRAKGAEPFDMTVRREGKPLTVTIHQHLRTVRDDAGVR